jgi:hypothetical protein
LEYLFVLLRFDIRLALCCSNVTDCRTMPQRANLSSGSTGFEETVIPTKLPTDVLALFSEAPVEPVARERLQALMDAVPVALVEFRLQHGRLMLLAANAAARRMPGLGAVRNAGVDAA